MITIRKAATRGRTDAGWLDSRHSFSFGHYFDPEAMGFGPLRVINDDRVAGGGGFPPHPHADMEIVSYVLEGALQHRDSLGTGSVIRPGDVQRMSAGTGVQHSEFNYSETGTTHFLQIWIIPDRQGVKPSYEEKSFPATDKQGRLRLVVSPDGADGSVSIHQDARMYAGLFDGSEKAELRLADGRLGYVHIARGEATVNGQALKAGDALLYRDEPLVSIERGIGAEVLVFDLPTMQ